MRHTIVIELPDGADPNEVERTIARALEARNYVTAVNSEGSDYGRLKVVEYRQEQVTERADEEVTSLEIQLSNDGEFSLFTDVCEFLWPGQSGCDNHTATDAVKKALAKRGCKPIADGRWLTPEGLVSFDSEADSLGAYSLTRGTIEYVVGVIEEMRTAAPPEGSGA